MQLLKTFCTHIYCLGIYKLVGIKYYIAYFPRGMQIVVSDSLTHCQNCNCQICTSYTCTYHEKIHCPPKYMPPKLLAYL